MPSAAVALPSDFHIPSEHIRACGIADGASDANLHELHRRLAAQC